MKQGAQNAITEHQVRIVAGGHWQIAGVDFDCDKTFYATVKNLTQQAVLVHVAKNDWSIHHIDVKSTYLNAKPEGKTPTYMTPSLGYLKPSQKGMVLEILKCLYGLAQSGWGWYDELCGTFRRLGFMWSKINHSVFIWYLIKENEIIITAATDDMVVTGNLDQAVQRFKDNHQNIWYYWSWQSLLVSWNGDQMWSCGTHHLHQSNEGMATKFRLTTAKPIYITMLPTKSSLMISHCLHLLSMSKCWRHPMQTWLVTCCGPLWSLDLMLCSPWEFSLNSSQILNA